MKIIIDAMGGDNAPQAFLDGGFRAAKELGVEIVLVGKVEQLLELMKAQGIDTLPNINEMDPSFFNFIISGKDSVVAHYLKKGASGWRLDVADELPMEFIRALRSRVKA